MSDPISHVLSWAEIYLGLTGRYHFNSLNRLPLPNLGFSLMGFTAFHLDIATELVSVALYGTASI